VQGSAKELIRELTPQQLQHGDIDPMTGQQLTGLMLLVTVLAQRNRLQNSCHFVANLEKQSTAFLFVLISCETGHRTVPALQ